MQVKIPELDKTCHGEALSGAERRKGGGLFPRNLEHANPNECGSTWMRQNTEFQDRYKLDNLANTQSSPLLDGCSCLVLCTERCPDATDHTCVVLARDRPLRECNQEQ